MARRQTKKRATRKRKRVYRKPAKESKLMVAFQKLKRMKPHHQREAIKMCNANFIQQLCTQVKKMRNKPLPSKIARRMKTQKKNLQKFIRVKTSTNTRRKMLSQRGGFLPLLIAALPAVGAMVGNIIGRARRRD